MTNSEIKDFLNDNLDVVSKYSLRQLLQLSIPNLIENIGSSQPIVSTTVDLGLLQIGNLKTVPPVILPAPGANKYREIKSLIVELNFNTTQWVCATPVLFFSQGNQYFLVDISVLTGNEKLVSIAIPLVDTFLDPTAYVKANAFQLNQPLTLSCWDGVDPVDGDSTMKVKVEYVLRTFG